MLLQGRPGRRKLPQEAVLTAAGLTMSPALGLPAAPEVGRE